MLVLAFDTSSPAVTVAVVQNVVPLPPSGMKPGEHFVTFGPGPVVLAEQTEVASNRHGELLAPLIDDVLRTAGVAAADLDAIAVGLGPGPFTGLRVGIMTAKAMGDALGVPVYGECSLDVIAHQVGGWSYDHDDDREHEFVVLSDARRKQVYWATYSYPGFRLTGPELGSPADVAAVLTIRHVAGAGAELYSQLFEGFISNEIALYPSAASLASMVMGKLIRREPADDLTPLYLRRPDAVPPGKPKPVTPA